MKQCVIFDMDGAIIDSEPLHKWCEKEIFATLGISVSDDIHNSFVGTTDELMWTRIASLYRLSINISDMIGIKKSLYLKHLKKENLIPIAGILELITELHNNNFLIALASSAPREQIDYILETFGLKHFFNSIISGDDISMGKPNPEIFLSAAKAVGTTPEFCVVIEDSYNGIIAAKNANMKCIAYKNPNSGDQDLSKADIIVTSIYRISLSLFKNMLPQDQ